MRARWTAPLLALVGLGIFATFVTWFELRSRAQALKRIEQHSRAVEPALWNLDPRLASDYFTLAAVSYGYESISVSRTNGALFLERHGPELRGVERWLNTLGLFPRISLAAPVLHEGAPIGTIRATSISRTVYIEAYVLLAIILVVVLVERSMRVAEGKRTLELRVAERTRQLAASEASHRQLTRLLNLAPDVIFVREADGAISYWNKGAEQIFGPGDRAEIEPRLQQVYAAAILSDHDGRLRNDSIWVGEFVSTRPDGREMALHASLSLTPDEAGGLARVLFIATDITARRNLESHLLRVQRTEAVGTLASGIAHDFNNLLTPILLSTQMLRGGGSSGSAAPMTIDTIESCARRGAELVRQLLNLSGSRPALRTTIHLPAILRDISRLLKSTFPKSIRIEPVWPEDLPAVEGDPTNIHQAILNLCVNARDSMPGGGLLRLEAALVTLTPAQLALHPSAERGGWIRLAVTDTGSGIPRELQERIFDPFFTTKEIGKGTGLGLATVQGIMRSHGGFVELESEPGHGATFALFLQSRETAATAARAGPPSVLRRGSGELLLIVDDEPSVLQTTSRLLESFGYRTLVADSGQTALALHTAHASELRGVLTDLMMPEMDGVALAHSLQIVNPSLPIAVTTGLLNTANRERIAALGITVILSKPYEPDELLAGVQRLVQTPD